MVQAPIKPVTEVDVWLSEYRSHIEPLGARVERVASSMLTAAIIKEIAGEANAEAAVISAETADAGPGLLTALERLGQAHKTPATPEESRDERLGVSLAKRRSPRPGRS